MIIMKKIILLSISAFSLLNSFGQQDAQTSMYFFNPLQFNSAYAGSREALTVTAVTRAQWIGWDGAPKTQFLSVHAPVLKKKIAVGATVNYDKIGARSGFDAMAHFAYHMQLNKKDLKLSFGASAGIQQAQFNFSGLNVTDIGDLNYQQSKSVVNSNFGLGVYLYNNNFYAGASIPRLLKRSFGSPTDQSFYQRHFNLMAGYVFKYNSVVAIKPSILFKSTDNAPASLDLNLSAQFYDQFWVGLLYRFNDAIGFNASYILKDFCTIGYAYDFPINGKLISQWGSHELVISMDFKTRRNAYLSPRYF
jgi:type IX secretion system PorP/SprF family membrane protein